MGRDAASYRQSQRAGVRLITLSRRNIDGPRASIQAFAYGMGGLGLLVGERKDVFNQVHSTRSARAAAPSRASAAPQAARGAGANKAEVGAKQTVGDPFPPVTLAVVRAREHRILEQHPVRVNLEPYCVPQVQDAPSTRQVADMRWLGSGTKEFAALYDVLRPFPAFIALHAEAERKVFVASFEASVSDWAIQSRIPKLTQFQLELRPGCHTREQRERAEQVLKALATDPAVGPVLHTWRLDPSTAGYRVHVLPGSQAAAAVVRARLGSIANVWFTRPAGEHARDAIP